MQVIDFSDSSLADYFNGRRHLIAAGLRGGYTLGNTRICSGCEGEVDPITLACPCFAPPRNHTR